MFNTDIIGRIKKFRDRGDATPKNDARDPRIKRISDILDEIEKYGSENETQESVGAKTSPKDVELPGPEPVKKGVPGAEFRGTQNDDGIKADISEIKEKLSENVKLDAFLEDTNAIKSVLLRTVKDIETIQAENAEMKNKLKKLDAANAGQINISGSKPLPAEKAVCRAPENREYFVLKKSLAELEKGMLSLKKEIEINRAKTNEISSKIEATSVGPDAMRNKAEKTDFAEFKSELDDMKSALEALKIAGSASASEIKINDPPKMNTKRWRFDVRKHLPDNKVDLDDLTKRLEDVRRKADEAE